MSTKPHQNCPPSHPSRLLDGKPLFIGRNRNLPQRLEALAAIAAARVPSRQFPELQDIDQNAPHYCAGISRQVVQ